MNDPRAILYHKQATSARTRFLKFSTGSACALEPLPQSAVRRSAVPGQELPDSSEWIEQLARDLGLEMDQLQLEYDFHQWVEISGGAIPVLLIAITTVDPPFAEAEQMGATFVDLIEARGVADVELELLREAYQQIMG